MSERRFPVRALVTGRATGPLLTLDEPLSLWGGLDPTTGRIIDPRHPQVGAVVGNRVLVMPRSRGSSSASSVLAECIRAGVGPTAIVLARADAIITLGALAAAELYPERICPVVVTTSESHFAEVANSGRSARPGATTVTATVDRDRIQLASSSQSNRRPNNS